MRAIERVMAILEVVAGARAPIGPARVADATGLSRSTVARLMQEMAAEKLLDRVDGNGSYRVGARLALLVQAAEVGRGDAMAQVEAALTELRDRTGETSSLHVRSQGQRVCVAAVHSTHALRRVVAVGESVPLVGSATGEVLLAGAPEPERQAEIARLGLDAAELRALEERMARIREDGYALNVDGWVRGAIGLSVPVQISGVTIAALSVAGPSARFSAEVARAHVGSARAAAERIAAEMAPA